LWKNQDGGFVLRFTTLSAVFSAEIVLACLVLGRLFWLRLHGVYRVFAWFLMVEIPTLILSQAGSRWAGRWFPIDYRIWWLVVRIPYWILYVWMVYALLQAVMFEYPGVHKLSARVLNGSIAVAAVVGTLTAARSLYLLRLNSDAWQRLEVSGAALERTASIACLILLLGVLGFLLWFPVEVPRNLVVFSITYVVFFAANVASYSLYSASSFLAVEWSVLIVSCLCYTCFLVFLSEAGEHAAARIGHSWKPGDRERLLEQLGALNAAVLGAGRPRAGDWRV
jgi:hypothetical protein